MVYYTIHQYKEKALQTVGYILGFYLIAMITIAIHEVGHLIAARLAGFKPKALIIGHAFEVKLTDNYVKLWPVVGISNPKGISIGFSPIPLSGRTLFDLSFNQMMDAGRWRAFAMASGGILMQIICMLIIYFTGSVVQDGFQFSDFGRAFFQTGRALVILPAILIDGAWMTVTNQPGPFLGIDPNAPAPESNIWQTLSGLYVFANVFLIYTNLLPSKGLDGYYILKALRNEKDPDQG